MFINKNKAGIPTPADNRQIAVQNSMQKLTKKTNEKEFKNLKNQWKSQQQFGFKVGKSTSHANMDFITISSNLLKTDLEAHGVLLITSQKHKHHCV